jgi:integrase
MKLTAVKVRSLALPTGKPEAIFWDDDVSGFGVRLREGGSRNFVFQYKLGDKQRRMALGSVAALDFSKARDTAKDLYARVRLGQDPAGEKAHAKVKAAETFEAVAALYLARQRAELRPHSYVEVERHLLVHAKPLHRLQLVKIARRDIAMVTAAVTNNSGAVTGNRARASMSAFFNWCLGEGLAENNPVLGSNRNEERPRERLLSPTELKLVWTHVEGMGDYTAIVRLLALTGARANEIAALRRPEICDDAIVLPGERTKNHRPHLIPLSQAARAIIDAQPRRTNGDGKLRDLVFGLGSGPFSGWSTCKERLDQRIEEAAGKIPDWRIHDLRRAAATGMAEIGVQPHIVEAVLNHVSGHKAGVAGVYNLATYEVEKRGALNRWAEHLLAIVENRESNVTSLQCA